MAEQQQQYEGTKGPSTTQVLTVVTLLPVGGTLLFLAGVTFVGTLIGLAITTPLFLLFSPVLVPAALVLAIAVAGFLTSGAFGITALSSLSWMVNYLRIIKGSLPEQLDAAKKRTHDTTSQFGLKAREMGQATEGKTQEVARGS